MDKSAISTERLRQRIDRFPFLILSFCCTKFSAQSPKGDKVERSESSQDLISTERSLKIKELEKLITVERRHLEAAEKMAAPLMNSASNVVRRNWKSAVEVQMDSSKQRLAGLVAELEKLSSVRITSRKQIVQRLSEKSIVSTSYSQTPPSYRAPRVHHLCQSDKDLGHSRERSMAMHSNSSTTPSQSHVTNAMMSSGVHKSQATSALVSSCLASFSRYRFCCH